MSPRADGGGEPAGPRRVVLLAWPAGHSASPAMHGAAFRALGIDARYEALETPPERLPEALDELRADPAFLGANVTVPHKEAVRAALDGLDPAAEAVGAVNTIVRDGERLLGRNTDAAGFLRALVEDGGFAPRGRRALLIGAGGAGRAVAYALLSAGAARVDVWNRTAARAAALADDLAPLGDIRAVAAAGLAEAAPFADLVVNGTSVGMERGGVDPDASPLPAPLLAQAGMAVDLVYRPRRTRFLRDAEAAGRRTLDGLPMLVYQGAEAFEAWTGRAAPVGVMRRAVERAVGG